MTAILQPIAGLYRLIATSLQQAEWNRESEKFPRTDPHISHDAGVKAGQLEKDAERYQAQARADVALINAIELLVHDLETSSFKSALRTLALRALQSASDWLRRELGDMPELVKPKRRKEEESND
jgi:hypothetical protein